MELSSDLVQPPTLRFRLRYPVASWNFDLTETYSEVSDVSVDKELFPMTYLSRKKMKQERSNVEKETRRIHDEKIIKTLKSLGSLQNRMLNSRLRFRCHFEEHKRRADARRRKIVLRLQHVYQLNLDYLSTEVTDKVVSWVEKVERKRKEMIKHELERKIAMITRLLEEQQAKHKALQKPLPTRRYVKKVQESVAMVVEETHEWAVVAEEEEGEVETEIEGAEVIQAPVSPPKTPKGNAKGAEEKKGAKKEKGSGKSSPKKDKKSKKSPQEPDKPIIYPICTTPRREQVPPENILKEYLDEMLQLLDDRDAVFKEEEPPQMETRLESIPSPVLFENFEVEKEYVQPIRITNVGPECLHCRYVGVEAEEFDGDATPIKVPLMDQTWLRSGLGFKNKIYFKTSKERELHCHLIYETRRKTEDRKLLFYVPIVCTPARAIVTVTPQKIIFPSLTWCEAMGEKRLTLLRKPFKIKNSGGKTCSCYIIKATEMEENASKKDDPNPFSGEEYAGEYERASFIPMLKIFEMVREILESLLNEVFEVFRFSKKYFIVLPAYTTKIVNVTFQPQHKGYHSEKYYIKFEDCYNTVEEALILEGTIRRAPIHVEPAVIDLRTCIVDSGVYQGTFQIFNNSSLSYPVTLTLPKCMARQAHVYPASNCIPGRGSATFSIKFYPRSDLKLVAGKFFDKETDILDFPIVVNPSGSNACRLDRHRVFVIALVTDFALELTPNRIDFGKVSTLETVWTTVNLTNNTLSIQEFAFLNLPKPVRIEPNKGFGRILPGDTIQLRVLYSPTSGFMEGNPLGVPSNKGEHRFTIRVSTFAELARCKVFKPEVATKDIKHPCQEYVFPFKYSTDKPPSATEAGDVSVAEKLVDNLGEGEEGEEEEDETENDLMRMTDEEEVKSRMKERQEEIREYLKQDLSELSKTSFFQRIDTESENAGELGEEWKIPEEETHEEEVEIYKLNKQEICCRALITDPLCELSDTVIQLPATPCASFSMIRFYLLGTNRSTMPRCYCGLMDKLIQRQHICGDTSQFQAFFEFQFFCPHIKFEPQSGHFKKGEVVTIKIVFRPEFPPNQLRHESRIQKMEKEFEKAKELKASSPKTAKGGKGKPATKAGKDKLPNQDATDENLTLSAQLDKKDFFFGEKSLQELVLPHFIETKVQCVIKIECEGHTKHTEVHNMIVIGPVIKPSFILNGDSEEICFGKVAIGTRPKKLLEIRNILVERICPSISILNPVGSFSCPTGGKSVLIDPEHVWRQPITFAPTEEKGQEIELFEVRSGATVSIMKLRGEGIAPQYAITPEFGFYRFEARKGASAELKFDFRNECEAVLPLQFVKKFEREGWQTSDGQAKPPSPKSKKQSKKEKPVKMLVEMTHELKTEMDNDFPDDATFEYPESPRIFTVLGVDHNNEIIVQPFTSITVRIRYTPAAPRPPPKGAKGTKGTKESPRTQATLQRTEGQSEYPKKYATQYQIMLGRLVKLADFVLFGNIMKEGKGKK